MEATSTNQQARYGLFIGRYFGIRFYLDYSWFLIAAIVTYVLAARFFPHFLPERSAGTYLTLGAITAGLYFLSILLHELGHSIVSQRCGIPVPRITLLFIGGIAEISREPDDAKSELKIALGGPVVTVVLTGLFYALMHLFRAIGIAELGLIFEWLAMVNLVLLIFNAIPGYPLDGGRVLRAILWARSGKLRNATYITTRIGIVLSWLLMGLGVIQLFSGIWSAFVLLLIGIFIRAAAESGYSQAIYREVLSGVKVEEIMSKDPVVIPSGMPVNLAVDDFFLANHHVAFPVCESDGTFRGLLRLEHLKGLAKEKWPFTSVDHLAAENESETLQISAGESAATAMRRLLVPGQGRLAVIGPDQKLAGIITRHDILQFIKIHTQLAD